MKVGRKNPKNLNKLTAIVAMAYSQALALSAIPVQASPQYVIAESSSSQDCGVVTATLQRIEDQLFSQKTLSPTDYSDLRNRLMGWKKTASLDVSKGSDASSYVQPIQSFEQEVSNRIKEAGLQSGSRKAQTELELTRLEEQYNRRKGEMHPDDAGKFDLFIGALRIRIEAKLANLDDQTADKFIQEARDIESKMMDSIMFKKKSPATNSSLFENNTVAKKEASAPAPMKDANSAGGREAKGKEEEEDNAKGKPGHLPRPVKKPLVPIPKIIERIENELIDYHDKKQIGSFDMDSFTERLLRAKRNLHVMLSKTGRISARQEFVIRADLEQLREDITNRIIGKD